MLAAEFAGAIDAGAQYMPERRAVRKGNRQFDRHNYKNSIDRYIGALDADSTCYEALYNLGNAYYQANLHRDKNPNNSFHWSDADSIFTRIGRDTLMPAERRAEALRNLGESQLTQQRFEEALASFKESLKLNPADRETKYNYILAKRIVDQQKQNQDQNQNGGGGDNNQNQNQNQNQNGEGNGDGGNDQQNQNQDQNGDGDGDNNNQNQDQNRNNDRNQDRNKEGDNDRNQDPDKDRNDDNDNDRPNDNDKNNGGNDRDDDKNNDDKDDNRDGGGNGENENDDRAGNRPPRQKSGMSREEQQRMLEAVQAEEDKTQDKLKEKGTGVIVRGKKNW